MVRVSWLHKRTVKNPAVRLDRFARDWDGVFAEAIDLAHSPSATRDH